MTVVQRVSEFQVRELTFDVDCLDAIVGIFHHYQNLVDFVYGLPIGASPLWWSSFRGYGAGNSPFKSPNDTLTCTMAWSNFGNTENMTRRSIFPTWTWAGWKLKHGQTRIPFKFGYFSSRDRPWPYILPTYLVSQWRFIFENSIELIWEGDSDKIIQKSQLRAIPPVLEATGWTFDVEVEACGSENDPPSTRGQWCFTQPDELHDKLIYGGLPETDIFPPPGTRRRMVGLLISCFRALRIYKDTTSPYPLDVDHYNNIELAGVQSLLLEPRPGGTFHRVRCVAMYLDML